jgi:serine/threonine protein kinase
VAIKLLRSIEPAGPSRRRFEREAELITQLRHQNVISVLDAGEREGAFYLIMEYVDGRPIDEFVAERRPPLRDLLGLFAQICDGVNAAHLRGIIHRDLKPANMLIDSGGLPRVVDFGLAKLETGVGRGDGADASGSSVAPATLTNAGQFIGSLPWASPEQAAGDYSKIDVRSDVYSLGVILYQLLTGGHFPYDVTGSTRDVLNRIVSAEPTRPRAVVVQSPSSASPKTPPAVTRPLAIWPPTSATIWPAKESKPNATAHGMSCARRFAETGCWLAPPRWCRLPCSAERRWRPMACFGLRTRP